MTAHITYGKAFEDGGSLMLARVLGADGDPVEQADVSSIVCTVSDITTGTAVSVITPSVTVGDVVFDTMQTDSVWTKDSVGYNFKHALPSTAFPTASHVYRVEYKFTPASGAVFYVVFQVTSVGVHS